MKAFSPFLLIGMLFVGGCNLKDELVLFEPQDGDTVGCPLRVQGRALGSWFFEATFPVRLVDAEGQTIFQAPLMTSENWMTEDYIGFEASFYYQTTATEGTLILENANASGLPENAKQVSLDVTLNLCDSETMKQYQKQKVEAYVRAHISTLSPVEPVLGGTWYVTTVVFLEDSKVSVTYEDGHIEESFDASYSVDAIGNVFVEVLSPV